MSSSQIRTPATAASSEPPRPEAEEGRASGRAPSAPLETPRVRLRPVSVSDYEQLFTMVTMAEATSRWRFRGSTPSPEAFGELLWGGVVAQFAIEQRSTGRLIGLVSAFDASFSNQTVHLAVLLDSSVHKKGWPFEGILLFLNYLFEHWPFRKIYAEAVAFNAREYMRGSSRLFQLEGTLRAHEYYADQYWDVHLMALYRERWLSERKRYRTILESGPAK